MSGGDSIGLAVVRLHDAINDAHLDGLEELDAALLHQDISRTIDQLGSGGDLRSVLEAHLTRAQRWTQTLERLLARIGEETAGLDAGAPGSAAWRSWLGALDRLAERDPDAAGDRWLDALAGALATWRLDVCTALVTQRPNVLNRRPALVHACRAGVAGLRDGRPRRAVAMVEQLLEGDWRSPSAAPLPSQVRSALLVLLGRIYLSHLGQPRYALAAFERAVHTDPTASLPYAALGHYHLRADPGTGEDRERAAMLFHTAVERAPWQPDGYVGLGLLAESRAEPDPTEAESWYRRAVEHLAGDDQLATLTRLLAPTSGNLFLQLARTRRRTQPATAVAAARRALELGVMRSGNYPERVAYRMLGEALEQLRRRPDPEAAEAFWEAGRRFAWEGEHDAALELLERAGAMDPRDPRSFWYRADSLLATSVEPKPPYRTDPERLRTARRAWVEAIALATPPPEESWAYLTGVQINQLESQQPGVDHVERYWEAVTYAERAILLRDSDVTDAWRFALLSRFHRAMGNNACALQASTRAMELLRPDLDRGLPPTGWRGDVLEEYATACVNMERLDEALANLERMGDRLTAFGRSVKAYVWLRRGRPKEAVEETRQALEEEPENPWYRYLLATAFRRLGDRPRMLSEYAWVVHGTDPDIGSNIELRAVGALFLGELDLALKLFTAQLEDPARNKGESLAYLALTHIARQEPDLAAARLDEALAQPNDHTWPAELLDLAVPDVERFLLGPAPAAPPATLVEWIRWAVARLIRLLRPKAGASSAVQERSRSLLDRMGRELAERQRRFRPAEPLEELSRALRRSQPPAWAWWGATAGVARTQLWARRWREAVAGYRELDAGSTRNAATPAFFPEASRGLDRAVDGLLGRASVELAAGGPAIAIGLLRQALAIAGERPDSERLARVHARLALASLQAGDLAQAETSLAWAFEGVERWRLGSPAAWVAMELRDQLTSLEQFWTVRDAWRSLPDGSGRHAEALAGFDRWLTESLRPYHARAEMLVRPIVLRLPAPPSDDGGPAGEPPAMGRLLSEMSDRIEAGFGVRVPPVHVVHDANLGANQYTILLNEVPVAEGYLPADARYCEAPIERLHALGVPTQAMDRAPHPITGAEGCWVRSDHLARVREAGVPVWEDPLEFPARHLQAKLLLNLRHFADVEYVEELLARWAEADEDAANQVRLTLASRASRVRLARAIGNLLAEGVSIVRWKDLLEALPHDGADASADEVVRAIRLRLRTSLPGNELGCLRLLVPEPIEARLRGWLRHEGSRVYLKVPRGDADALITDLDGLLPPDVDTVALVVRAPELRPLLWQLMAISRPGMRVLAEEELVHGTTSRAEVLGQERQDG